MRSNSSGPASLLPTLPEGISGVRRGLATTTTPPSSRGRMRPGQGRLCSRGVSGNLRVSCRCCSEHPSCSPALSSPMQIKTLVALPSLRFGQSPALRTHLAFRVSGFAPCLGSLPSPIHLLVPASSPATVPIPLQGTRELLQSCPCQWSPIPVS